MSDAKGQDEPSMEEILSSIRKIISEDDGGAAEQSPPPASTSAPTFEPPSPAASGDDEDDVLELTDMVADESKPQAPPAAKPAAPAQPQQAQSAPQQGGGLAGSEIVSNSAARAASGSFAQLSHAMQTQAAPRPAETPVALTGGGQSVESLAVEILRPMLRDWVDQNLPQMVERLVSQEIRRMTGGG